MECNEGYLAWIDNRKLMALPLWEGDRIFMKWLDRSRFFSARFVYKKGVFQTHSVVLY